MRFESHQEKDFIMSPKSPDPLCGPRSLLIDGYRDYTPGGKAAGM